MPLVSSGQASFYFIIICDQRSQIGHTRIRTSLSLGVQNGAKIVEKCNLNIYFPVSSPVNRATFLYYNQTLLLYDHSKQVRISIDFTKILYLNFALRLSSEKLPAPCAKTYKSPPDKAIFFIKEICCIGSKKFI